MRIARLVLLSSAVALSLAIGIPGRRDLAGGTQIVAVRVDGSAAKNLTHRPFDGDWPAVSPDGRKIAFVRNTSAHGPLDHERRRPRTAEARNGPGTDEVVPSWSPDGKRIAFVSMTPCEPYFCSDLDLWVVRTDGSGLRKVGENVRQPWRPLWSPDGTRLLFGQIHNPHGQIDSLAVLRVADGAVWTLGDDGRPVSNFEDWSWSPDGRRVAYTASNGNTTDAYVEGAKGQGRRLLAHFVYGVQWSPAGKEIAISKRFGARTIRVATVPVRGGAPRKIAGAQQFAWDRSGRRLALFRGSAPVAVVGRDGRQFRIVSRRPGWPDRSEYLPGPARDPGRGRRTAGRSCTPRPPSIELLLELDEDRAARDAVALCDVDRAHGRVVR